jgi:signal transduction histidine kinase
MDAPATPLSNAIVITAIVIACLLLYFIGNMVSRQRKRLELQRRYFLDETALLEKERTRIARDIHDELGPLLTATRMQLQRLQQEAGEEQQAMFRKTEEQLAHLTRRLREIAANLTPAVLVRKGLKNAIHDFLERSEELSPIRFSFICTLRTNLPPSFSIHLYRIVQEIVHNAIRHSRATQLAIRISEDRGRLYLSVMDNGQGFTPPPVLEESEGMGLRSIYSRTAMLGGLVECVSAPGKGVDYFIDIPLKSIYGKSTRPDRG